MPREIPTAWAVAGFFESIFDIHRNTLRRREVLTRDGADGEEYEVGDFYRKCADLIAKRLTETATAPGMQTASGALKDEKLREEVRKLRMQNDIEERNLVPREEVLPLYVRAMRPVVEKLDRIPLRVKMKAPDVPSAILAVITECVAEARNEAAKGPLDL